MKFSEQTQDDLLAMGFRVWNASNLYLIPYSLYSQIEVGEEVYSRNKRHCH